MTDIAQQASIFRGAGRYAPSPSGNLHLGNLRTALVAWLAARSSGRQFLLRIDDIDTARDGGYAAAQEAALKKLGLDFDGETIKQTARTSLYSAVLKQLQAQDLTYECVCSRKDILTAPTAPHSPPGAYPGTCRNLSDTDRQTALAEIWPRKPAIRLKYAGANERSFYDEFLGQVRASVDDFVLQRGDGTFAYNLVTVIDDALTGVDQVVRGADLASSTPRQIVLAELLGLESPKYLHIPLVVNLSGQRLAKRDGAVTLEKLHTQGVSAQKVLNLLAVSLELAQPGENVTAQQLIPRFDIAKLPRQNWIFKPQDLLG